MGPPQAEDPRALSSLQSICGVPPGGDRVRALTMPFKAPGWGGPADVQRPNDFARRFPANSHERSAQTRIGLGRTLVRIGRRRSALRTALLSMAQGPLSPRALSRPGLVAAAQKWHGKEAAQLGTPAQWSVPGSELKDGWWTGVRLRLSGRWGGKGWG